MVRMKQWDLSAGARDLGVVEEAMTKEVVAIELEATLADAARELERADVSGAPVLENGRVVGVVTLRDLLSRAPGSGAPAVTTGPFHRVEHLLAAESARTGLRVRDVMSRVVRT
ncbi:MAG: CBS domain-containing protein, partial [Actinomycetota bacterium]